MDTKQKIDQFVAGATAHRGWAPAPEAFDSFDAAVAHLVNLAQNTHEKSNQLECLITYMELMEKEFTTEGPDGVTYWVVHDKQ
jgi:hypothetical protein